MSEFREMVKRIFKEGGLKRAERVLTSDELASCLILFSRKFINTLFYIIMKNIYYTDLEAYNPESPRSVIRRLYFY